MVWNSVRSTFRAPSNLSEAVMLKEKKLIIKKVLEEVGGEGEVDSWVGN